ncbi:hypothetical protein LguiA_036014 [Lonicera macranthoides]
MPRLILNILRPFSPYLTSVKSRITSTVSRIVQRWAIPLIYISTIVLVFYLLIGLSEDFKYLLWKVGFLFTSRGISFWLGRCGFPKFVSWGVGLALRALALDVEASPLHMMPHAGAGSNAAKTGEEVSSLPSTGVGQRLPGSLEIPSPGISEESPSSSSGVSTSTSLIGHPSSESGSDGDIFFTPIPCLPKLKPSRWTGNPSAKLSRIILSVSN